MGETAATCELSVVVPVFNEEANLRAVDAEIAAALDEIGRPAEVVYVDDGSTDGSAAVLAELLREAAEHGGVRRVVTLRRNFGQTAALAAGFDAARGAVVVSLDGDGQNDPADIPRLVARLDDGFDVVSGWRRRRRDKALSRRLPSWAANLLISALSGVKLHDYGCTLKAYRARLLREVRLYGDMHRFIPAYLARLGARITELEVHHRPRLHGVSHYGGDRIVKVLLDLVLIRFMSKYFTRPLHFFGQAAVFFGVVSLALLALMVTFKYGWLRLVGVDYQADFVQTPLPALGATFFSAAIASLFFGILGEILVRIYYELRDLRPYAVASIASSEEEAP